MKKTAYISFNEGRMRYPFVHVLLKSIDCEAGLAGPENFLCGLYGQTFDDRDPRLQALRDTLKRNGIKWSERIEHIYTDAELRAFPYLRLTVDRKEIDPSGPSHGTTYDLSNACPQCGCGAVQTSPFYAPAKSLPRTGLLCASNTEVFVAEKLADAFRRAEVTGLELRQVLSAREHEALPWWQIIPRFTMPKLSPATKGIVRSDPPPCTLCGRDGHFNTMKEPEEIVYSSAEVDAAALPDIVATWECFSVSRIDREDFRNSRFAQPAILLKPSVFDIFRKLKVKHARLAPVQIE
ncbi:hypothetical protein RAS2_25100 [Phycisphaerae bacterium RAS2]|nr:hypothetical protein RAS2_25100 [Phycisphaerae bacterium RAS2]